MKRHKKKILRDDTIIPQNPDALYRFLLANLGEGHKLEKKLPDLRTWAWHLKWSINDHLLWWFFLHPRKLTWNPKIGCLKMFLLFQRGYFQVPAVSFGGCILFFWKISWLEGNLIDDMGVSKNRGKTPKMDGENSGKSYEQMDDLGGSSHPYFWFNTHIKMVDLWKAIALQEPKKLEVVIALVFLEGGRWKVILHVVGIADCRGIQWEPFFLPFCFFFWLGFFIVWDLRKVGWLVFWLVFRETKNMIIKSENGQVWFLCCWILIPSSQ